MLIRFWSEQTQKQLKVKYGIRTIHGNNNTQHMTDLLVETGPHLHRLTLVNTEDISIIIVRPAATVEIAIFHRFVVEA